MVNSQRLSLLVISIAIGLAAPTVARAGFIVSEGFDLFQTIDGTQFDGVDFEGVPLGEFDFGGTIGSKNTGNADTIVQRLGPASVVAAGQTVVIDIELVALQLRSVAPVDWGAGLDFHYVTLDENSASLGTMAITFDDMEGGTFDAAFTVFFDIRIGALDAAIIGSDSIDIVNTSDPWGRIPPQSAVIIDGVNV